MKLTLKGTAHRISEMTIIRNDAGDQVAPVGSILVTLEDGPEFAFAADRFRRLFPGVDLDGETKPEPDIPHLGVELEPKAEPEPVEEKPAPKPKPRRSARSK